jgi:hypothetical protein
MNTNEFFSLKRFNNLLRNDLLLNYKRYLFTFFGAVIVVYLYMIFQMRHKPFFDRNSYSDIFLFCTFAVGAFVGSAFPELSNKKGTCNYLLLPASVFEKFLVQFIIRFVICISLSLLFFWIDAQLARLTAMRFENIQDNKIVIERFQFTDIIGTPNSLYDQIMLVLVYFSMGTFLFSARLFFRKFALVKSVILGVALFYLCMVIMVILSHIFYPETRGFNVEIKDYHVFENLTNNQLWGAVISSLSWVFFLFIGYYKLKEKQE